MVIMFNFLKKKKTGEVPLNCPRCNVVMDKIRKEDVVIDVCPDCNGMWLDDKEIDKLAEYARGGKDGKKRKK